MSVEVGDRLVESLTWFLRKAVRPAAVVLADALGMCRTGLAACLYCYRPETLRESGMKG